MLTTKDRICAISLQVFSTLFTTLLLMISSYTVYNSGIEMRTIIGHIISGDCKEMVGSSSLWAFPFVISSPEIGSHFCLFLPFLTALPFIYTLSAELKGFGRFKITREKSFVRYFSRTFFRSGLSGAGCVTAGYMLFSAMVYAFFPQNGDFPLESPDINPLIARRRLSDSLNALFGTQNELLSCLGTAVSVFVAAFLISIICLMLFLVLRNKYKALGLMITVIFLGEQISQSIAYKSPESRKFLALSVSNLIFNADGIMKYFGMNRYILFAAVAVLAAVDYFVSRELFRKRVMN